MDIMLLQVYLHHHHHLDYPVREEPEITDTRSRCSAHAADILMPASKSDLDRDRRSNKVTEGVDLVVRGKVAIIYLSARVVKIKEDKELERGPVGVVGEGRSSLWNFAYTLNHC